MSMKRNKSKLFELKDNNMDDFISIFGCYLSIPHTMNEFMFYSAKNIVRWDDNMVEMIAFIDVDVNKIK